MYVYTYTYIYVCIYLCAADAMALPAVFADAVERERLELGELVAELGDGVPREWDAEDARGVEFSEQGHTATYVYE